MFKPHSTRMASTIKASKEVSLENIMKTAGWRRETTFTKYYKRPIIQDEAVGEAVLKSTTPKPRRH